MAVSYVGKSIAMDSSNGAITVTVASGVTTNDLLILVLEGYNAIPNTPASGSWTSLDTNTNTNTNMRVCYRIASASEPTVNVADSGDSTRGVMFAFRGADLINPIASSYAKSTCNATSFVATANFSTTLDGCMIACAIGFYDADANDTANYDSWASTGITVIEGWDESTSAGSGGGIAFAYGSQTTAGIVNNFTASTDNSGNYSANILFVIQPVLYNVTVIANVGVSGSVPTKNPFKIYSQNIEANVNISASVPTTDFFEEGYHIERKAGIGGTWTEIAVDDASPYVDSDTLVNGTTYYYRIRYCSNGIYDDYSNEISVVYTTGVNATGISSTNSFGTISFFNNKTLSMTGYDNVETIGTFVFKPIISFDLIGISTTNTFGTIIINITYNLPLIGINSTVSFGVLDYYKNLIQTLTGINSTISFGNIFYSVGNTNLSLTGISSGLNIGTPIISRVTIIRHEINLSNVVSPAGNYYNWTRVTTASYSGNCTWYFEVCGKTIGAGLTVTLLDSLGNAHATLSFSETEMTVKRVQLSTAPTTDSYRFNVSGDDNAYTIKLICLQNVGNSCTGSETQIEIGDYKTTTLLSDSPAILDNPKYFTYNSANWDGTVSVYFETNTKSDNDSGTTSIILQEDDGNWDNWTTVTTNSSNGTSTTRIRSSNIFSSLTNGRHYRVVIYSNNASYTAYLYTAKLIFVQTGTVTKLEETQFIMISGDSGSTGLQPTYTKYNSSDWNGIPVICRYSHDATNASDASKLYNVTDSADITEVITGANQQISDVFSAPTDGDILGINVTNTTGNVCYGRILAQVNITLQNLSLTGISSTNTFGTTTFNITSLIVTPTGISSTVNIGTLILDSNYSLVLIGISSTNIFGTPVSLTGNVNLSLVGINSTSSIGNISFYGVGTLSLTGISSTITIGTINFGLGLVILNEIGIDSTITIGTLTISIGIVNLLLNGIGSTISIGNISFEKGNINLFLIGIDSVTSIGTFNFYGVRTLSVTGIALTNTFGTLIYNCGNIGLVLSGINSSVNVGTIILSQGNVNLLLTGIDSTNSFGILIYNCGNVNLSLISVYSTDLIGTPTLNSNYNLSLIGILSNSTFGTLIFNITSLIIIPTGIDSIVSIGTLNFEKSFLIEISSINSTILIGNPYIYSGQSLELTGIDSSLTFGMITYLKGNVNLLLNGINSTESLGTPILTSEFILQLIGIDSTLFFGTLNFTSNINLSLTSISSSVIIGTPTILKGTVNLILTGISSTVFISNLIFEKSINLILTGIDNIETLGTISFEKGNVNLSLIGIDSSISIGTLSFYGVGTLSLTGINSTEIIGVINFGLGSLSLVETGINSTLNIGILSFNIGTIILNITSISSTVNIGIISFIKGEIILTLTGINPTVTFGIPNLINSLVLTSIPSTITIGNISFIAGNINFPLTGIDSTLIIGTSILNNIYDLGLTGISSTLSIGIPILNSQYNLLVEEISNVVQFGMPILINVLQFLSLNTINSSEIIGEIYFKVDLNVSGILLNISFGIPNLVNNVSISGISSTVNLGSITYIIGEVILSLIGIDSTLSIGDMRIIPLIKPSGINSTVTLGTPIITTTSNGITFIDAIEITPAVVNTWTDIDLTGIILPGSKGVLLHVETTDTRLDWGARCNGSTDNRHQEQYYASHTGFAVGVDSNLILELYVESITNVNVYIIGYFDSNSVFNVNATNISLGTTDVWTDINVNVGENLVGAIFEVVNNEYNTSHSFGLRKNGSSDNRYTYLLGKTIAFIGVDESNNCEGKISDTNIDFYLQGYIKSGCVFLTNATDLSLSTTDVYKDLPVLPNDACGGFIEYSYSGISIYNGALRKNGSSEDIYRAFTRHGWMAVECDANHIIEGKISNTNLDFFLTGYVSISSQQLHLTGIASTISFGHTTVSFPLVLTGLTNTSLFGTWSYLAGNTNLVLSSIVSAILFGDFSSFSSIMSTMYKCTVELIDRDIETSMEITGRKVTIIIIDRDIDYEIT